MGQWKDQDIEIRMHILRCDGYSEADARARALWEYRAEKLVEALARDGRRAMNIMQQLAKATEGRPLCRTPEYREVLDFMARAVAINRHHYQD